MAMAGTEGAVNERRSMPTLLNDTNAFAGPAIFHDLHGVRGGSPK